MENPAILEAMMVTIASMSLASNLMHGLQWQGCSRAYWIFPVTLMGTLAFYIARKHMQQTRCINYSNYGGGCDCNDLKFGEIKNGW